ncbi:glycosyltransferase family 2 protein [Ornithinimicrobium ciconiae]|nr:glycosyltransferase family 2 protein [Ornithinimicrobium ciconiae]
MSDDPPGAPRVSAILPLHDPGPGLRSTIAALLATLSAEDELVVVDDASGDGTADLLRDTDWQGLPVQVVRLPERAGVAAARNHGLTRARGEMVWFVDWDDRWDPAIVGRLYAARLASGAPVVGCGADLVDTRGRRREQLGEVTGPTLLTGGEIGIAILDGRIRGYLWNKLFAREVLGESPFPPRRTRSDFAGSAELMARQPTVYLIPDLMFHHVQRPGSLTTVQHPSLETLRESQRIGERVAAVALAHPDGPADPTAVAAALHEFRHREWHVAVAGTAMRAHHDPQDRAEWLRIARDGLQLRAAVRLFPRDRELALRVAVLAALGAHYPLAYRAVLRVRPWVRRVTGRGRA